MQENKNHVLFINPIENAYTYEVYVLVLDMMDYCKIYHNLLTHTATRFVFQLKEIQYFSLNKRCKNNARIL